MNNINPENNVPDQVETSNHTNPPKKPLPKLMVLIGLLSVVIILSWLGVKLVAVFPTAVNSLANLAESVYNYRTPELAISTNRTNANNGETIELSWTIPKQRGTFGISYECAEGVSVDITRKQTTEGLICNEITPLGSVSGVTVQIFSERVRHADVPFTIHFFRADSEVAIASNSKKIMVTNTSIENDFVVTLPPVTDFPDEITPPETAPPTPPATTTPPLPTTSPAPRVVQQYVYGIPVSDPNGYTDLTASFITSGHAIGTTFFPQSYLVKGSSQSAIQFEIKNIGTKTSGTWTYLLQLPNGTIYSSPVQEPLKPNERAVITRGFSTPAVGNYTVVGSVIIDDTNLINNSFSANVAVR